MIHTALASLLIGLFATAPAHAQVTVTEPPDLSNDVTMATPITLGVGTNTVSGSLATPSDRQDNFTVTVPAGDMLAAVTLTLDTHGGFVGSVTFNLSEVRSSSGSFTMGFPFGPGTYFVQVVTDFSVGNTWSMRFTVTGGSAGPVCGDGTIDAGEECDDSNTTACDGCSPTCAMDIDGCNIDGACVAEGTRSTTNGCEACLTSISRTAFSPAPAGTTCVDSEFCTESERCDGASNCVGTAMMSCTDGDACTDDECDEASDTCMHSSIPGCGLIDAGPRLDAGTSSDAGSAEDAGTSGDDDAGAVATDAGAVPDAGPRPDAGTAPPPPGASDDGCGCRTTADASPGTPSLILAIGLWLAARRRNR